MYDIEPLESEWKAYQHKKKKPYYLVVLGIVLLALVSVALYKKNIIFDGYLNQFEDNNVKVSNKKNISSFSNLLLNEGLVRLETVNSPDKEAIKEEAIKSEKNEILVDIPILDIKEQSEVVDTNRKKVHLNIIKTSTASAYEDVEKRFYESHDIDDALFLARSYYKKGNYNKTETWAYEVNKIDSNLEEGLLLFIKSKYKLGRKNDALSILNTYLKKSNSADAKNLLYKIENNKL